MPFFYFYSKNSMNRMIIRCSVAALQRCSVAALHGKMLDFRGSVKLFNYI